MQAEPCEVKGAGTLGRRGLNFDTGTWLLSIPLVQLAGSFNFGALEFSEVVVTGSEVVDTEVLH